MNSTHSTSSLIWAAARKLSVSRARYLDTRDGYALEMWEDASAEYFNLTGKDHPLARYASTDAEG